MLAIATALAAAAGPALWLAVRFVQRMALPILADAPPALALAANAGIEEALRLGLALAIQAGISAAPLSKGLAGLGVLSSTITAALEHASYVAAFPTLDAYWRLGYSGPIHSLAAALYALAASPAVTPDRSGERMRPIRVTAAFLAAWGWHSAFNLAAALWSFPALPALGTALNLSALGALCVLSALRFGYTNLLGSEHGKR